MAKKIRLTSPKGIAKYPWLTKPSTKFNSDGVYQVKLVVDPEEAKDFIAEIDKYVDESYKLACEEHKKDAKKIKKSYPYEMETDDEGEETGKTEIKFKRNATFKDKDTGEIVRVVLSFFDAKGKAIESMKPLYGGSTIRVNCNVSPYYMKGEAGITLYINAVQVIKAVLGGDGSSYGFANEDDGFNDEADDTFDGGTGDEAAKETKENPDF